MEDVFFSFEFNPQSLFVFLTFSGINEGDAFVQFPESSCEDDENRERMKEGLIGPKYWCFQIRKEMTIYRDANNIPVEVTVNYKAGCELRCVEKNCGRNQKKLKLFNKLSRV